MTRNAEGAAGDVAADLTALRQDVTWRASPIRYAASCSIRHRLRAAASSKPTGQRLAGPAVAAQNRICTATGVVQGGIERNPLTTVAVALAVGMLLGLLFRSWD